MKTNQNMTRYIGEYSVIQRTKDGYFDGSSLLNQWNANPGNPRRRINEFMDSPKTKDFIKALSIDESLRRKTVLAENQLITTSPAKMTVKGKVAGKTWMHPLLFIKFAMWINPAYEVTVLRFVYDQMIKYRNSAGDAYRELAAAVARITPPSQLGETMKKVGEALNWIIFNRHEPMMRNKDGQEERLQELWTLERKVADLINEGFIPSPTELILYLRTAYTRRHPIPV